MRRLLPGLIVAVMLVATTATVSAQAVRGVVEDQTGLPLPGAIVQVRSADRSTPPQSVTTAADGTFEIKAAAPGSVVVVSLDGFETATVPLANAARIVLQIAHTQITTDVVASTTAPAAPTSALLGSTLTATSIARLPSAKLKAKESLPLLPSVVRGPDGLLQLGGARPHEAPVLLDGFNITDPATGTSSVNLPFEAVRGVAVIRDPMAVTYGSLLGGLITLDSKPGGDHFTTGVQGFIPRPRFTSPGFGRLEGIFPRVYAGGPFLSGRGHYMTAAEYDYERIPVPGVTQRGGPDVVESSSTVFGRADFQMTSRDDLSAEAFVFPSASDSLGLSPLRDAEAAPNLSSTDTFAGLTVRHVFKQPGVLTVRLGFMGRSTDLEPPGTGPARLSPDGWQGNSFSTVHRSAIRRTLDVAWERTLGAGRVTHDVTVTGAVSLRRLQGQIAEGTVLVEDAAGLLVRSVTFGQRGELGARDRLGEAAARDVIALGNRVQIDTGVRLDSSSVHGSVPSARAGVRYTLDATGATVLKAGLGEFVNTVPLATDAFAGYPTRTDRRWDASSGALLAEATYQPTVDRLTLPRAVTATIELDRQIATGLDAQIDFTNRQSSHLATLDVPLTGGPLAVQSSGTSHYRELGLSVRRQWKDDQQVFVSYVLSSSVGERNDFATLFRDLDRPLLQPGGMSPLASDAPHRWVGWGTFNVPGKIVISPVLEWHSGFPYSVIDDRRSYVGVPNSHRFPAFSALDMVVYRTFSYHNRKADIGVQLFNTTDHFNPRDVYAVAGAPSFGSFTNSVGTIVRGFMLIKW